ncbi:dCTP deaminase [Rhodovulum sp. P5]|uniref:dCTP deaminase n=1 Tax=Rhodovulum sp. P5 TaxID=1564506 RepID=UPI0015615239|nr:dCTP deaminase [Rhodovulum sp. P5]
MEIADAILSGDLVVTPLVSTEQLGPTIDLRLGTEFSVKRMDKLPFFDVFRFREDASRNGIEAQRYNERVRIANLGKPFFLHPGQLALGSTLEHIELGPSIGALLEGRSSWAREGLNVHTTAGFIHPGSKGVIVLELFNNGQHALPLYPGMRVAQLLPYRLKHETRKPYSLNSRYHGMTETRIGVPWEDWEFDVFSKYRK